MWSLRVWVCGTMASSLLGCGVKKADNVVNLALWIDLSELEGHRRGYRRASGPHAAVVLGWAWSTGTASLHRLRSPSPNSPCRMHPGSCNRQSKTKVGGRGRAADSLNTGPAPALLPLSLRSARAAAAMICLLLTIFANLFPAGEPRDRGRGAGRAGQSGEGLCSGLTRAAPRVP